MDEFDLGRFYEILAICHYNSERKGLLHPLIKKLFTEDKGTFDYHKEIMDNSSYHGDTLGELFKKHDSIITSGLTIKSVVEYIFLRYGAYRDAFFKTYGIPLDLYLYISLSIWGIFTDRITQSGQFSNYQFVEKKDYANINFFALPNCDYIKAWKEATTVSFSEILEKIDLLSSEQLAKYLELYSFTINKIKEEPNLRFREYPLFYYSDKVIIVDPDAFIFLPHKIDFLLRNVKSYESKKGLVFENIILNLIDEVPCKKTVYRNIDYGGFELDGLLNFKRSTWFVECKSRNLSTGSLKGDKKKIEKDIEKSIHSAIKQGERAIHQKDSEHMSNYGIHNLFGIIVVVEGIFPNLRLKSLPNNPIDFCKFPVCVFNYFDLRLIIDQKDANMFEEFLIWRSQKKMPIYAFDECDYWDFYTKMKYNKNRRKAFKTAQEKDAVVFYIGDRFNDKRYLSKSIVSDK